MPIPVQLYPNTQVQVYLLAPNTYKVYLRQPNNVIQPLPRGTLAIETLYASNSIVIGNTSVNSVINSTAINIQSIFANGSIGAAGQILTSNGSGIYWSSTGGVLGLGAGDGLSSNNTDYFVLANSGIVANSSGTFVDSAYIATLTANDSTNFGGLSLATVEGYITGNASAAYSDAVANAAAIYQTMAELSANVATLTANDSTNFGGLSLATVEGYITGNASAAYSNAVANAAALYQTTAGLAANVATLTANNANNLGGQNSSFYTNATNITTGTLAFARLPANAVFWSNTNSFTAVQTFSANVILQARLSANGSVGSAGQVLTSSGSGSNVYWSTPLLAGNGLVSNTTHLEVRANSGIVANSTGAFVNAAYIGTLTANDSTNFGGLSLATVQGYITGNAATAYSNAVANAAALYQTTAGLAANVATLTSNNSTNLGGQNSSFYTNATNITTGTLGEPRLPFRMDQDVRKTDNIEFHNAIITGNLTVSGVATVLQGNNIVFTDNMLYLNQGVSANINNITTTGTNVTFFANNNFQIGWDVYVTGVDPSSYNGLYNNITAANSTSFTVANTNTAAYVSGGTARGKSDINPDIGIAAGYNDGTYHHTGIFRDATDAIWKVFEGYEPEPDASIFIDTTDPSFKIANFQANFLYLGNTSTNWVTANQTGIYAGATLVANSTGAYGKAEGSLNVNSALTANNSTNLGGQNSAYYTNATNITTGTLAFARLPANAVFWSNTNSFTAVQTFNQNLIVNSATLSVGNTTSNVTANTTTIVVGNSTVNSTINSTAFSGTAANATLLNGQNGAFYTNATNITTGTLAFARLPANAVFWSNTNSFTAVQTFNANLIVNVATLSVGNSTSNVTANTTVLSIGNSTVNVTANSTAFSGTANNSTNFAGLSLATVEGYITGNAATAYSNAVANAAALYQTTAGLAANVATLTANNANNLGGQNSSFYTNATNITTGTLAFARLPANAVFWSNTNTFTAVQTFNQNLVVNAATLSIGNSTSNVTANTTTITVGNSTVNVTINSTAFSGTANDSTYLNGTTLSTIESYITGNSDTAYTNAVNDSASAAALVYQTTADLAANVGKLTANDSVNLDGQPGSYYTNATNITTGTLDVGVLPANIVFWSNTNTFTAVQTFNANVAVNTSSSGRLSIGNNTVNTQINSTSITVTNIVANGQTGSAGQVLTANGTGIYWSTAGATFSNGTSYTWSATQTFNENVAIDTATLSVGNTVANVTVNTTNIIIGNSSVNVSINSTAFSGTSSNSINLNGQPASYYTNATNLATGTVPTARLASGTANSLTFLRGDSTWAVPAGGGGTPGGNDTEIQFNDSSSFGAANTFTFNKTSVVLNIGNTSVNTQINSTAVVVKSIVANGQIGTSGQVLASNGTGLYWTSAGAGTLSDTYESVNKNLKAYDAALAYHGNGFLNTITYSIPPSSSIVKTFNYTGSSLTSIVLSGSTPGGIDLTKTFGYSGDSLISVTYS
jgi:hypothetical protein